MHIVIDARIIHTSTGRYVERLLTYLEKISSDDDHFTVLVPSKDKDYWQPSRPNFEIKVADFPSYSFSEQLGLYRLLKQLKPDLVHFCMPQQPLLYRGKRVTTIHDLTLVRFDNIDMNPLVYHLRKIIFTWLLKNVIKRSDAIITPTDFVRQDVIDFSSPAYASKITTTLEAWDQVSAQTELVPIVNKKPFIFFVGNAFPYRNLATIVDAFGELYSLLPDLQLVFAGKKDFFYEQLEAYIQNKGITNRVHILGFISEGQKRWLFQHAQAYVVASLSEGFHIPGLEAMSEDCPVISSNATCLPEVYGTAAYYFDPKNSHELAMAIKKVTTNDRVRRQLQAAGKKRLKNFSWQRMAKQTHRIYMQVLKGKT